MKKIIVVAALLLSYVSLSAQTGRYEQRYNLLVSKLGPAGVGIETLLDSWAKADSTDEKMLSARISYYLTKSQRTEVVKKSVDKYLGMKPLLSLKDSLGTDVYYYQETFYDDELFGQAIKSADKAISLYPDKIDYRFIKANAYIAYEKESPDMALAYLLELVMTDASRSEPWLYGDEKADEMFFQEAMQEYCYSFYQIGSPQAREAFHTLSKRMNAAHPDNLTFINNMGTYHLIVKDDCKTAMKYYRKVLKKDPEDLVALQNCIIVSKRMKNAKQEARYRKMYNDLNVGK